MNVKMKAPQECGGVGFGGMDLKIVDGYVDAPLLAVEELMNHGFVVVTPDEEKEIVDVPEQNANAGDAQETDIKEMSRQQLLAFLKDKGVKVVMTTTTEKMREIAQEVLNGKDGPQAGDELEKTEA